MSHKEVRGEIVSYVERKCDSFGTQIKAMEVDSHEHVGRWGGGECGEERREEHYHEVGEGKGRAG